jgi:hypothetical protein
MYFTYLKTQEITKLMTKIHCIETCIPSPPLFLRPENRYGKSTVIRVRVGPVIQKTEVQPGKYFLVLCLVITLVNSKL